ncbi:MAG: ice-binding family protein [Bacteroidota bacterium]|jgi:hypothetical protein
MKNAIVRTLTFTRLAMRPAVIMSISLAMFLLAACETNQPLGQRDSNTVVGPQGLNGSLSKLGNASTLATVLLGSASTFAVLGGTTVTNAGPSIITGDLGVYPGTAITGFDLTLNTIVYSPLGTVTAGLGIVHGTIYAGGLVGSVVEKAHNDAATAYAALVDQPCNFSYAPVQELNNLILTPGVHCFPSSANLQSNGTLTLDFQGNSNAVFIFKIGSTLVTKNGSKVIAINNNNQTCSSANVYWAVGSSATIDGSQFLGTVIAYTTITMTSAANNPVSTIVSGRMLALNGAVTMSTDNISVCSGSGGGTIPPPKPCRDFVTGGGWIDGKATFGVSGGIKNGKFWGELSFNDHQKNSVKVKSTSVTAYIEIDAVTRQIEGIAKVNGKGPFTYKVVVVDKGERGRNDSFSLELSNGYKASGTLKGGNIQLHTKCGNSQDNDDKEYYDDNDERDGHKNCDNDEGDQNHLDNDHH